MEKIELKAKARSQGTPNKVRRGGAIPAIVYGHNIKTEELEIPYAAFEKVFRKAGESTLVNLEIEGGKSRNVIIQDVQKHFLNGKYLHADFYEVSMTEVMKATVPLEFIGVSRAVKENGGTLIQVLNEVEVECLPADLPHSITVDISGLNTFSDSIHIADLKVDSKVKIVADQYDVVVKVSPPRDVEAELATPFEEDVSKVVGAAEVKPQAAEVSAEDGGKDTKKE